MKGSAQRRRDNKEEGMRNRVQAFEARRDRQIAGRHFDRELDAVKDAKRRDRQAQAIIAAEEDRMAAERLAQQRDAEATVRREILEKRLAREAESEARRESIWVWVNIAGVIVVMWWLIA